MAFRPKILSEFDSDTPLKLFPITDVNESWVGLLCSLHDGKGHGFPPMKIIEYIKPNSLPSFEVLNQFPKNLAISEHNRIIFVKSNGDMHCTEYPDISQTLIEIINIC